MLGKKEKEAFLEYLKVSGKKRFYLSQEFVDWYSSSKDIEADGLKLEETYEENKNNVLKFVCDYIDQCNQKYIYPEFTKYEYDDDLFYRTDYKVTNLEDRKNIQYKTKWRSNIAELISKLEWREFELLCEKILIANHISDVVITRSSKDQGIDFYGYFRFNLSEGLPRLYENIMFRVVGQAKHTQVGKKPSHEKIASFSTEVQILRKNERSNYLSQFDDSFLNSNLPVIAIFITNGLYSKKSIIFAEELGITCWDGEQISEDLSTENIINKIAIDDGKALDLNKFKKIIENL